MVIGTTALSATRVYIYYYNKQIVLFCNLLLRRSPRADPSLCGMVSGLTLSAQNDDLALLYLATIQVLTI